ncbi:MAG: type II toxin-antitoxin system VapC family toxin [Pseudohongiella sp.]|nr:type II toxin-antitoxin system VapC family toxin [Pseudohongiella sp.]
MEVKTYVLDTSALLAWMQNEPGSDALSDYLTSSCYLSTVNLAELVSKLVDLNHAGPEKIAGQLRAMGLQIVSFDETQALLSGSLRTVTRARGLSLGDRACLALAQHLNAEVVTADNAWTRLELPLTITNIRQH